MKYLKVRKCFYIPILLIFISGYISAALSSNIEVYHVYKILPAFIIYTDDTQDGKLSEARGIITFIHHDVRDDKQILDHELMHVKQAYRYGFQHWIPALFSDSVIAYMEAEAYSLQIKNKENIPVWAEMIKEEYGKSVRIEKIEEYLLYHWNKRHI